MMSTMEVLNKVSNALSSIDGCRFNFRPKQIQVMESLVLGSDVVAVLPTGFGKSITFHTLSRLLPQKSPLGKNITLVVSPLNAIIEDQIMAMKERGICAAVLERSPYTNPSFLKPSQEDKDDVKWPANISKGIFEVLLAHPEVLLEASTLELLRGKIYRNRVCALVIDEAHLIETW